MRIMPDSNIIVSVVYNPDFKPARALDHACENHELILCDHIVAECYDVVRRKFPQHIAVLDKLLASLSYELVIAPRGGSASISDPKDVPILSAAILNNVDIIISGDNHFLTLDLDFPTVFTPAQYLEYMKAEA